MKIYLEKLAHVMREEAAQITSHLFLCLVLFLFGCVLLLPGKIFYTGRTWDYMGTIGTEHEWALALFCISIVGFFGAWQKACLFQIVTLFTLATTHGFIALCLYHGASQEWHLNPSVVTYAAIALFGYAQCWIRVNIR